MNSRAIKMRWHCGLLPTGATTGATSSNDTVGRHIYGRYQWTHAHIWVLGAINGRMHNSREEIPSVGSQLGMEVSNSNEKPLKIVNIVHNKSYRTNFYRFKQYLDERPVLKEYRIFGQIV